MIHYNLHYIILIIVNIVNTNKNASLELLYDHYCYKIMNFNRGIIIIIRQQCFEYLCKYIFCMVLYLEYMYACSILFDKNKSKTASKQRG